MGRTWTASACCKSRLAAPAGRRAVSGGRAGSGVAARSLFDADADHCMPRDSGRHASSLSAHFMAWSPCKSFT